MMLKKDAILLYSDGSGVELKAGTTLPNGVQLSPKEITSTGEINKVLNATVIAPDDGVKLSDGTVIKSGGTLVGEAMVAKGNWLSQENMLLAEILLIPKLVLRPLILIRHVFVIGLLCLANPASMRLTRTQHTQSVSYRFLRKRLGILTLAMVELRPLSPVT